MLVKELQSPLHDLSFAQPLSISSFSYSTLPTHCKRGFVSRPRHPYQIMSMRPYRQTGGGSTVVVIKRAKGAIPRKLKGAGRNVGFTIVRGWNQGGAPKACNETPGIIIPMIAGVAHGGV